jgi:phage terminase large subunit-like protein
VAIDPGATWTPEADETGIIVAGKDGKARAGCLPTRPVAISRRNGRRQRSQPIARRADRIVAEVNHGGEMVEATLRVIDPTASTLWCGR